MSHSNPNGSEASERRDHKDEHDRPTHRPPVEGRMQISALHDADAFGELQGELEEETLEYGFAQQDLLQNATDPNPQQIVHPIEQRRKEKRHPKQINEPADEIGRREPREP